MAMVRSGWSRRRSNALHRAIEAYWRDLADMANLMPFDMLTDVAEVLLDCRARGRTIFVLGNGGSAATASHLACDLGKGTRTEGVAPFRVVALTDNVPLLTAWANDTSYERIFAEQLATLVQPGDVVVAISASGNSPNVLAAVETAREMGATSVALSGETGGRLATLADVTVRVPAGRIELVEDAHLVIAHSLCVAVRERLRAEAGERPAERLLLRPVVEPVAEVGD
ncbi:MAG: SIS domain-containing protein [Chloroflexota bacterium]|nr:SIS domain-containing protein [Chloroflexota bacterium]